LSKTCRKCGETKEAVEFRANRRMAGGLSSWCADCHNPASRRWRDRQRELVAEALGARRREHVERLQSQTRSLRGYEVAAPPRAATLVIVSLPSSVASKAAAAFELLLAPLDLGEGVHVPQVLFLIGEDLPPFGVVVRRDPGLLERVPWNVHAMAQGEGLEQMHSAFVGVVVAGHGSCLSTREVARSS
jgi:hypothetical protein